MQNRQLVFMRAPESLVVKQEALFQSPSAPHPQRHHPSPLVLAHVFVKFSVLLKVEESDVPLVKVVFKRFCMETKIFAGLPQLCKNEITSEFQRSLLFQLGQVTRKRRRHLAEI